MFTIQQIIVIALFIMIFIVTFAFLIVHFTFMYIEEAKEEVEELEEEKVYNQVFSFKMKEIENLYK